MVAQYVGGGGREPILSLTTIAIDRPAVEVNGRTYDLAMPDDFGVLRRERYSRLWARVGELGAARQARTVYGDELDAEGQQVIIEEGAFTFEEEGEWERTFARLAEIVALSAPPDLCDVMPRAVFDGLTSRQKYALVMTFFNSALAPVARAAGTTLATVTPLSVKTGKPKRVAKPTGAKRSRASKGSTAGTRPDG